MSGIEVLRDKIERARRALVEARKINDRRTDEHVGRAYAAWDENELAKRATSLVG